MIIIPNVIYTSDASAVTVEMKVSSSDGNSFVNPIMRPVIINDNKNTNWKSRGQGGTSSAIKSGKRGSEVINPLLQESVLQKK
jgi:hypothetical protein